MELFYVVGFSVVISFKEVGYDVFCDFKFYDIFNIVKGVVFSFFRLGVDLFIVYVVGGRSMMEVLFEGLGDVVEIICVIVII